MATAKAEVTISRVVDISSVTRYYLLQVSTASAPAKPTANPPGGSWTKTEPTYTAGSTNTLYTVELTVFTNNTFSYSDVSKSTSYEAAKAAYNKALESAKTATNYVKSDTTGLIVGNVTANTLGYNTLIKTDGFDIRNGSTVLSTFGASSARIGQSSKQNVYIDSDSVDIRNGSTVMSTFGASTARIGKSDAQNVYIDSDSVDIRKGSTVLSSFSDGLIELGKNSEQSVIKLCGGLGEIKATREEYDNPWLRVNSDGYTILNAPLGIHMNSHYDTGSRSASIYVTGEILGALNDSGTPVPGAMYIINVGTNRNNMSGNANVRIDGDGSIALEGYSNDSANYAGIYINEPFDTIRINGILNASQAATFSSTVDFKDTIYIKNGKYIDSYTSDGEIFTMLHANSNNNIVLGYGSYELSKGNTYIYGNQVRVISRDNLFYANGYLVPKMTKGDTSYYGMMTPENSTSGWIRTTESGLIPSAHGVSSIGSSSWQFKNGYFQNLYIGSDSIGTWSTMSITNVSTAGSSTAWVARYNKALSLVLIRGYVEITPASEISAGAEFSIGNIPSAQRPGGTVAISVYRNVTNSVEIRGRISTDGNIYIRYGTKLSAGTAAGFYVHAVYYKEF